MDEQYKDDEVKDISALNELYKNSENCDKEFFSEARVNIQLVAGDHYNRTNSKYWNRVRESRLVNNEQKIRITKNHIGRIARLYQNFILSGSPSVTISPKQEKEIQHQKMAELHSSVLAHIKEKHSIDRKISLWCKDYVEIGEVATKVFWDPMAGIQVGWEPQIDPLTDQPMLDEMGQPVASETPVMSGDLIFEHVHGFDLLRAPGIKSLDESPYLIIRKMESVKDLMKKFGADDEKKSFIKESSEDTFRVFYNQAGSREAVKGMVMVREFYFKPCAQYPDGYYQITTEAGILEEGKLPFGIFPIVHAGFDEITTSPRSRSIIRQLRPYQIEINRAASKMAEIQVTIGSDQVWYQAGSKPSSGASKPGIRENSYIGAQPIVIPGRVGEQYFSYIESQINEMYQIADVADLDKEINGQIDPYTLLFRSLRQKQKFHFYGSKFNRFVIDVHKVALSLFKRYANPNLLIPVLGKNEQVNISEFKNANDLCHEVKIEEMSDDVETKLGKQISLNHILQYVGPQLDKKDIGKFLRLSPYLNMEKMFEDMTQDYDNLNNDILALDRGQMPQANPYDNHEYMVKGLTSRMKQPDFKFLPPQIQQMYQMKLQEHEGILTQQQEQIKQAQSGFVPSGGYLVVCDLYVPVPDSPGKTQRVRVPSESLSWLLKKLEVQGSTQKALEQIGNNQAVADMAAMLNQGQNFPLHQ